jgi:hypothetical protein
MESQLNMFNQELFTGATFSICRKYRFVLWRIWDDSKPKIMFIGLNPSTANENSDDPTIRRVKNFANSWGYGGVFMLNIFTYVTAYPEELKKCDNPLFLADKYLNEYAAKTDKIIFAWGSNVEASQRGIEVIHMFPEGYVLDVNKNGSPKHPLYVKGDTIPFKYNYFGNLK